VFWERRENEGGDRHIGRVRCTNKNRGHSCMEEKENTYPEHSGIIMYAAHWRRFIHSEIFDLRRTKYYVLIRLLNGRDELCWRPKFTKKIVSTESTTRHRTKSNNSSIRATSFTDAGSVLRCNKLQPHSPAHLPIPRIPGQNQTAAMRTKTPNSPP
jgi:hypothetical protein